jgi:hypothetical protein
VSTQSSPVVPYWHVWTDADGISHSRQLETVAQSLHIDRDQPQILGELTLIRFSAWPRAQ